MDSEDFILVLDTQTSEPIYHVDGTVLVQRNSDGYQFFVDPEALMINIETQSEAALNNHHTEEFLDTAASMMINAENDSGAALDNHDTEELQSIQSSPSLPLSNNLPIEKHWSHNDILKLIDEYKKNKENFASNAVRNVKVWKQIAKALGSHDPKQCENKFKYLKSKYLKKKDNMSIKQSGAQRINFEYFDELDEIFKKQPIVVPVIASSSRENPIENIEMVETEREEANGQEQQQPRSRNIRLRDTLTNLNNILKESEKNKEKRYRELLSMHKESLDIFKTSMENFLEKI